MKKPGRNDPCVCGSGQKFKKCCERKMIGKKFMATKIETKQSASNIASFFKNKISQITSQEKDAQENQKKINAEIKIKENTTQDNILINSSINQESINNS